MKRGDMVATDEVKRGDGKVVVRGWGDGKVVVVREWGWEGGGEGMRMGRPIKKRLKMGLGS